MLHYPRLGFKSLHDISASFVVMCYLEDKCRRTLGYPLGERGSGEMGEGIGGGGSGGGFGGRSGPSVRR